MMPDEMQDTSPWFSLSLGVELDGQRHNVLPWLPDLIAQAAQHPPDPATGQPQLPPFVYVPRGDAQGVERVACITEDGIVLEVKEGDRVLFQATNLERGPQEASLFGVPAGYTLVDPQAVVESVGETMEQLDSVTGATVAPPTQAQAPTN